MKYKYTLRQNVNYFVSIFTNILSFFFPPPKRKPGISVMIRIKNEADWVAVSLLSLNGFADEVVIINNGSTDNTLKEIEKVRTKLDFPVQIRNDSDPDYCNISNEALKLTSHRWIVRWDADFIAFTSGKNNIKNLRKYLLSLNQKKYYCIYPLILSLAGDLFHVRTGHELHSEGYIHNFHPSMKYIKRGKFEVLKIPFFYKILRINEIEFFHIGSAKSWKKLLYRFYWVKWRKKEMYKKYPDLEDYIKVQVEEEFGNTDLKKITSLKFKEYIFPVRKYNINEFGDYPELLKPALKKPSFKITYKDGKPYSRTDFDENIEL